MSTKSSQSLWGVCLCVCDGGEGGEAYKSQGMLLSWMSAVLKASLSLLQFDFMKKVIPCKPS